MMLFGEITPLRLVEENMFAVAQVSDEKTKIEKQKKINKETETMIKTKAKREVYRGKEETEIEVAKEVQQEKALIAEQKNQNQCRSTNIFNYNIDFLCAGTQTDYEEELKFLEKWHETLCLDERYT